MKKNHYLCRPKINEGCPEQSGTPFGMWRNLAACNHNKKC